MWFSVPPSGHCFLPYLLLGSVLVNAIAIPPHGNRLKGSGAASISVPRAAHLPPSLERTAQPEVARAVTPLKPKPVNPADPVNPAEPNAPPPLTPNNPADSNPPPAAKPNNPADTVPAPAVEPHLGQQAPKANAKPDPNGPVPTETEITTLCSVPENKAIVWSGTSDKVHTYKLQAGLTSDSQAYPAGYTLTFRSTDNAKYVEFASRFSRVFARTAKGEVRLMVPWETGPVPTRTFHKDEWPILKEGLATGRITKIIQVNPNNWAEERIYNPTIYGLTKREKVDLNNVPWDVNLDALGEAWKRTNERGQ
ncbi:hypothetical protein K458DRAFT_450190 [Lentithecium fluviatile CBS 122367]|uniref:ADP-ribosylation n=1 Tax=Lentithecium fluviatile CBS 122367 TaxID=1168545 RepID=A0A6G1J4W9_9PLEO|nr:hypothetical protein K458DRAFT_450190 [Lentithecium fluviatile CBS 122367]